MNCPHENLAQFPLALKFNAALAVFVMPSGVEVPKEVLGPLFSPKPSSGTGIRMHYTWTLPCTWWCPCVWVENAMFQMGKMYLLRSLVVLGPSVSGTHTPR